MGHYTNFYGRLDFTRSLTEAELASVGKVIDAGSYNSDELDLEATIEREVEAERESRGDGPLMFDGPSMADRRAELRGFLVRDGLDALDAQAYAITEDQLGIEYVSEKNYHMVEGTNFIIANSRLKIPDFGLKGELRSETEFEPYRWLLKIGEDGWAHQVNLAHRPSFTGRVKRLLGLAR